MSSKSLQKLILQYLRISLKSPSEVSGWGEGPSASPSNNSCYHGSRQKGGRKVCRALGGLGQGGLRLGGLFSLMFLTQNWSEASGLQVPLLHGI